MTDPTRSRWQAPEEEDGLVTVTGTGTSRDGLQAGTRPLLELRDVTKRYARGSEQIVAVDGVDLEVHAGEFVALVGRSGSGKSTLLHLAGGLDQPDEGAVLFDSADLQAMNVRQRATLRRRELGFVFQFFHLLPSLTVAENVELPLLLDGRHDAEGRGPSLLDQLGIGHRRQHLPSQLSGGEMQRVAIARALVARPRLVLADEPTGNLDSATGAATLELLADAVGTHEAALLLVTHDEAVRGQADRVLQMSDGRLTAAGEPWTR